MDLPMGKSSCGGAPGVRTTARVRKTRTAEIIRLEEGIVVLRPFPGADQDVDEARENIAAIKDLSEGQPFPLLVDIRQRRAGQQGGARRLCGSRPLDAGPSDPRIRAPSPA